MLRRSSSHYATTPPYHTTLLICMQQQLHCRFSACLAFGGFASSSYGVLPLSVFTRLVSLGKCLELEGPTEVILKEL